MSDLAVALFGVICAFLGFLVGVGFACGRFKTGKWSYDDEESGS